MSEKKCPFCGHKWTPRVDNPRSCPSCKNYLNKRMEQGELSTAIPAPVAISHLMGDTIE
jgi:hypothetical protein